MRSLQISSIRKRAARSAGSSIYTVKCTGTPPLRTNAATVQINRAAASNRFHFYYNTADFLVPLPIFPLKKDHIRTAVLMWSLFFLMDRGPVSLDFPPSARSAPPQETHIFSGWREFFTFFQHSASAHFSPAAFPRRTGRPQRFERRGAIPGRSVRQNEQFNRAAHRRWLPTGAYTFPAPAGY